MKKILIIIGTAREQSITKQIAPIIIRYLQTRSDCSVQVVDVVNYSQVHTLGLSDEKSSEYSRAVTSADGIVIISPEYNHSFPGELKMLIDSADDEYAQKPVGICGVSSGPFGGARMMQSLKPVLTQLGMVPIIHNVYISHAEQVMNNGDWREPELWNTRIDAMIDEMIRWMK
jgi:NAD(P)H-dependent FMN reductase